MLKRLIPIVCLLFAPFVLITPLLVEAQSRGGARLVAGPMSAASKYRQALVWIQTSQPCIAQLRYWDSASPSKKFVSPTLGTNGLTVLTATLRADSVEPGRTYYYEILLDKVPQPYQQLARFKTPPLWQWRADPPNVRFALGSCFYVNEQQYDRPGKPYGGEFEILDGIRQKNPDLMIWLGDNVYTREVDFDSRESILRRYSHTRSLPQLQGLLAAANHYAIWDDHDYGPNDSDRSYQGKSWTNEAHRMFWPNTDYGMGGTSPGCMTTFQWSDAQFFMLDNRTFRSPNKRKTGKREILGSEQINWFIDQLANSKARFKFVCIGGQVINSAARFENYSTYPEERKALLEAIETEKIPGVIFLTGDRHHSELSKMDRPGHYPLFDLTISPLTAGAAAEVKEENQFRVDGTMTNKRNFGIIDIAGPPKARVLTISVHDSTGVLLWSKTIAASEIEYADTVKK